MVFFLRPSHKNRILHEWVLNGWLLYCLCVYMCEDVCTLHTMLTAAISLYRLVFFFFFYWFFFASFSSFGSSHSSISSTFVPFHIMLPVNVFTFIEDDILYNVALILSNDKSLFEVQCVPSFTHIVKCEKYYKTHEQNFKDTKAKKPEEQQ